MLIANGREAATRFLDAFDLADYENTYHRTLDRSPPRSAPSRSLREPRHEHDTREPVHDGRAASPTLAADRVPTELVGGAFFADLVRAHYAWERALADGSIPASIAELGKAYDETLRQFEAVEGKILDSYWCVRRPSAVAVTEKRQTQKDRLFGEQEIRLHRLSNWLMPRSAQKLDCLLHECDEFAIKSEEILRGAPKRIALRSIYEVQSSVLAFLERTGGPAVDRRGRRVRGRAKKRHARSARVLHERRRQGRTHGLRLRACSPASRACSRSPCSPRSGCGSSAFSISRRTARRRSSPASPRERSGHSSASSPGCRTPAKFDIDPQVGRRAIFYLGAYRPLVGAIFGLAIYFLLKSSLLEVQPKKEFATFVVGAFLGGFSERFLKVMLLERRAVRRRRAERAPEPLRLSSIRFGALCVTPSLHRKEPARGYRCRTRTGPQAPAHAGRGAHRPARDEPDDGGAGRPRRPAGAASARLRAGQARRHLRPGDGRRGACVPARPPPHRRRRRRPEHARRAGRGAAAASPRADRAQGEHPRPARARLGRSRSSARRRLRPTRT